MTFVRGKVGEDLENDQKISAVQELYLEVHLTSK
jgi:hypothetical protein